MMIWLQFTWNETKLLSPGSAHDTCSGVIGTDYADTASRAAAFSALHPRCKHDLRAFPRPPASSARAPARRPLDLSRPVQRPDVCGLGGAERAGDSGRELS